jgi:hypothetical protein
MLYDLWLSTGTRGHPQVTDFAVAFPQLTNSDLLRRMQEHFPGFIGLDLPEDIAHNLLARLQADRARGMVVASAYREPIITREAAYLIAEQVIRQQHEQRYPHYTLSPIRYAESHAHAMWWTFTAPVDELVAQGMIPGALFASIDKLDGHVWQPEDFERLFGET